MDERKLEKISERLSLFLPFFYRKVLAWHKNSEGLNPGHYMMLGMLMREGSMSMSDLSRRTCVCKSGVTFLADRLIECGMIERAYDPDDRRIINVSLTEKGTAFLKKHRAEETEAIARNLSNLSDEEVDDLCAALDRVRELIIKACEVDKDVQQG